MKTQVWFCEQCCQVGQAALKAGSDVWSAMDAIGRAHRTRSPECSNGVRGLRIINTSIVTSKEELVTDASIPEWVLLPASHLLGFSLPPREEESIVSLANYRLEHELQTILQPLGVATGLKSSPLGPQTLPTIVCLYARKDLALWSELQPHLEGVMKHYPYLCWKRHGVSNDPWMGEMREELVADVSSACLILLGVSIDLLTTFYGEGSYLLDALVAKDGERCIQPLLLRPVLLDHVGIPCRSIVPPRALVAYRSREKRCVEMTAQIEIALKELHLVPDMSQKTAGEESEER